VEDPEAQPALRVPERLIAAPHSISAEARAVLGRAAETPFSWPPYPAPNDMEGWTRYAEGANANMRMMIRASPEPGDDAPFESMNLGSFHCFRCEGSVKDSASSRRVLFQVHGGALIAGGGDLCRTLASRAALRLDAIVYAPDYRLPPQCPFPAALDDCVAAYRHVLGLHEPGQIVVQGSSAGGNLAAALMLRAKAESLPMPAGLVLETPQLDLTESGDSFQTNEIIDVVLQHGLGPVNRLYANGHDLANPLLSPLFGDFSGGWPPTLLTAGTRDLFLSNAVRMLHGLRDAGAAVELLVYEAMPHGGFFGTPEDQRVHRDVARFAQRCWGVG
jgi:monoterpene epsilon-lactone hydrolase